MKRIIAYFIHRPEAVALFILAVIVLISRWWLLATSLWHDDAFNFVHKALELAINGSYQNAHSTGYPLWTAIVALSLKVGHWLTGQWQIIFIPNLLSDIFSSLLVYPVYYLAKFVLRRFSWALLATVIIVFNPVIWNWSVTALSDIMTLFLALSSWALFWQYIKAKNNNVLWLSNLALYLALLNRPIYLLLWPVFLLGLFLFRRFNRSESQLIIFSWLLTALAVIFTYWLINNFSLSVLLSGYGSVWPNIQEILLTALILLKSSGSFLTVAAILGAQQLFKKDRQMFYFLLSIMILFWLYLAGWYRHGIFDIERYGLIFIPVIIIMAAASLFGNKFARYYFILALAVSGILTIIGLTRPLTNYYTYVNSQYLLVQGYLATASQVSQHHLIDGDLVAYQDLASVISDGQLVIHWQNDWSMPKLMLAGPQLANRAKLLSINSAEGLQEILSQNPGQRIYLLRGVSEAYLSIGDQNKLQSETINGRSQLFFVDN